MPQTLASGLVVPNQDGSDHHREWEHAGAMAGSVAPRLPRVGMTGPTQVNTVATGGNLTIPNVIQLNSRGPGLVVGVFFSVFAEMVSGPVIQTIGASLVNLVGATLAAEDMNASQRHSPAERWRGPVSRLFLLTVTAAAGSPISAGITYFVGTGASSVTFTNPRALVISGLSLAVA